jgi:nucleoid DNA-binding protein
VKKPDIVKRMARRAGVSRAEAADSLDRVVHQIVLRLKSGQDAGLPGLGTLKQSGGGVVRLEPEDKSND